jgi:hypothetical protein
MATRVEENVGGTGLHADGLRERCDGRQTAGARPRQGMGARSGRCIAGKGF